MAFKILQFGLFMMLTLGSCKKKCEPLERACNEQPPTHEACQAYFQRWFYDKQSNRCELKAYSGCAAYGFETLEACESCVCNH